MNAIETNNLSSLAVRINLAHADCESGLRKSLTSAIEAGKLLADAKELVSHGQWLPWLTDNCACGERTAQGYMRLAKNAGSLTSNTQRVSDLTIRGALAALAEPVPGRTNEAVEDHSQWLPPEGETLFLRPDVGFAVVAHSIHEGFYHVGAFVADITGCASIVEGTRKPVRAEWVAYVLKKSFPQMKFESIPLKWDEETDSMFVGKWDHNRMLFNSHKEHMDLVLGKSY